MPRTRFITILLALEKIQRLGLKDALLGKKSHLKDTGRLVTYAAASHVRRAMQTSGLVVARAPGFGGKREMTVAAKDHACLEGMSLWKTKPSGELR